MIERAVLGRPPSTRPSLRLLRLCLGGLCVAAATSFAADTERSVARVRSIVLQSRQMGAHGLGYGSRSLTELSRKLGPADIPALLALLPERSLRTGVQFALASQCEAALVPVREAMLQRRMDFLGASDVMSLVSGFEGCAPPAQARALALQAELEGLDRERQAADRQQARQRSADDARIQRNGAKMAQDPRAAAQELSRAEREEVFRRALNAMNLKEDGPMTPQQRELVQRMYRTMVLGEPGAASSNTPAR